MNSPTGRIRTQMALTLLLGLSSFGVVGCGAHGQVSYLAHGFHGDVSDRLTPSWWANACSASVQQTPAGSWEVDDFVFNLGFAPHQSLQVNKNWSVFTAESGSVEMSLGPSLCTTYDIKQTIDAARQVHVAVELDCTDLRGNHLMGKLWSDNCYVK
jgi:hypothetical protein